MSIESRIAVTGLAEGDRVYAWKTPTQARINPLQTDLFLGTDHDAMYDYGTVVGFIIYPAKVYPIIRADGSDQEWPYPPGVWRPVSQLK